MDNECKDIVPSICGVGLVPYFADEDEPIEPSNKVCSARVCTAKVGCDE